MAKAPWCGDEVYAAAVAFKERCLIGDDSLFTPGEPIWSPANVDAVATRIGVVQQQIGSFADKLVTQLTDLTPAQIQLGAEMVWFQLLCEADTSHDKSREHLDHILAMLPAAVPLPPEIAQALDEGGVSDYKQSRNIRDAFVRLLARLSADIKSRTEADREDVLSSPWRTHALVEEQRTSKDAMTANAFLHLMFPEEFSYMLSGTHRDALITAFAKAPGVLEAERAEEKIARITELVAGGGKPGLNLYDDTVLRVWQQPMPPRWAEAVHWATKLFEHPDFVSWERDYKLAIATDLASARDALLSGANDWEQQLRAALSRSDNNLLDWRVHGKLLRWVEADAPRAAQLLGQLWGEGDHLTRMHGFLTELPGEAASGVGTRLSIATFLLLAEDPARLPFYKPTAHQRFNGLLGLSGPQLQEIDPEGTYRPEELAARLGVDGRRVRDFLRRTYPREDSDRGNDWYLGGEDAQRVVDEFAAEADPKAPMAAYADWTSLVEELRLRTLAAGVDLRDLLDAQGLAWWLGSAGPPDDWSAADKAAYEAFRAGTPAPPPDVPTEPSGSAATTATEALAMLPDIPAELATSLHLPQSWLQTIVDLLAEKRQLILYGPPGTGKTWLAQALAGHLTGQGGTHRLVQFHPSYTYEDFFEGYRPRPDSNGTGGLSFEIRPGALRELAAEAENEPSVPHLLVVDEINRGNIAKIFGELYFLLEYRSAKVRLQYSPEEFSLPENLFLIGTMNTADRSIALLDSALRRRFNFVGMIPTRNPIDQVLPSWLGENGYDLDAADCLKTLNDAIGSEDFAIGPSYFITRDAPPNLERIWEHQIMPLLVEHFYGSGRDLEKEFGLTAIKQRVAKAAESAADDADNQA